MTTPTLLTTEEALEWIAANGGALASMRGAHLEVTLQITWRGQPVLYRERVGSRGPERWQNALRRLVARVALELDEIDREAVADVDARLGGPGRTNRERLSTGPNNMAKPSEHLYQGRRGNGA